MWAYIPCYDIPAVWFAWFARHRATGKGCKLLIGLPASEDICHPKAGCILRFPCHKCNVVEKLRYVAHIFSLFYSFNKSLYDSCGSAGLVHEDCITKMRLMSLLDLSSNESGEIPYSLIRDTLQVIKRLIWQARFAHFACQLIFLIILFTTDHGRWSRVLGC